jgi:hypothetical protein
MDSQMILQITSLIEFSSANTAYENRVQSMSEFVYYFAFDAGNPIDNNFDSTCLGLVIKLDKFKVRLYFTI